MLSFLGLALGSLGSSAVVSDQTCPRDKAFGDWVQEEYKDTRTRVLERYAIGAPIYEFGRSSEKVKIGSWIDAFTGRKFQEVDAAAIQIDHIVPVCFAWSHGAKAWSKDDRQSFFNDTRFLRPVEASLNSSKGEKAPDQFLPPNRPLACKYVRLFLEGVEEYKLTLSPNEHTEILKARTKACKFSAADGT